MKNSHEGRTAIVTGAGGGIGQAIAMMLAERGAKVVLVDLKQPSETLDKIGDAAVAVVADVSREEEWSRLGNFMDERFGRTDIVVNNAGIYPSAPIEECDFALWKKVFAVNLEAHFHSAKTFVPRMRKNNWGRFVNISSNSIGVAAPGLSHYMASKMGVIGFVRGLANDVGGYGITVNAVLPSITDTPGMQAYADEYKEVVWQAQAIKRIGKPVDIAGPVVFLTSDDAAFITGQALVADGGLYKIS
jgi:NAD(P)-dependent dehydrogenase (short-subunit alcohol dehydrogenase family)